MISQHAQMMTNQIKQQQRTDNAVQSLEKKQEETMGMVQYIVDWIKNGEKCGNKTGIMMVIPKVMHQGAGMADSWKLQRGVTPEKG